MKVCRVQGSAPEPVSMQKGAFRTGIRRKAAIVSRANGKKIVLPRRSIRKDTRSVPELLWGFSGEDCLLPGYGCPD